MTKPKWHGHFGLQKAPFDKTIEDDQLWLPERRRAVLDDLGQAVREHQHVLFTGEPGVGKTCTLRALRRTLSDANFRLTYCHNATLKRRDFYRQLCMLFELPPKASSAGLFLGVSSHIEALGRDRVHPVLLLDEAHLLPQDVLEHLHILANYAWDSRPLLSIVLVGLPDLWAKLSLGRNRSLWSRIGTKINLGEADPADTNEYVEYRLADAGCTRSVFSSDALSLLHEAAQGRLRDIDRLATLGLKAAARRKLKIVDGELMTHVIEADTRPEVRTG
jgi:type II secretory pathway predicted ATPase ExeA